MPVWHEAMRVARAQGDVVMLGVIQEQHAQRCRLFAQWKQFDWPILHDPINKLGLTGVPMVIDIDAQGVTRSINPKVEVYIASLSDTRNHAGPDAAGVTTKKPDLAALGKSANRENSYSAWMQYGDALVLWGDHPDHSDAIEAYEKAKVHKPESAEIHFRLGVAHRMRYDARLKLEQSDRNVDSERESDVKALLSNGLPVRTNDFRTAIRYWGEALEFNPNHYIYRRRIQQYGPRLYKPYPFYDWVEQARREITARGETPIQLAVEPTGAEIASPEKEFAHRQENRESPDSRGRINRDAHGLVRAEVVVVPQRIRPGESVRVHVQLEPTSDAHWNNENEPLVLWLELPPGWQANRQWHESSMPRTAESSERRSLEFEIKPAAAQNTRAIFNAYALYYICETSGGTCLYLRQDIPILIEVAKANRSDE